MGVLLAAGAPQPELAARTNPFAIVALVLGILGVSLLAVIFGHISLNQMKRTSVQGRGTALARTIFGWLEIGFGVALIAALAAAG